MNHPSTPRSGRYIGGGRGQAKVRVEQSTLQLSAGDMLVVEPGEGHTFLPSSPDYLHFVKHVPGLQGAAAKADKIFLA